MSGFDYHGMRHLHALPERSRSFYFAFCLLIFLAACSNLNSALPPPATRIYHQHIDLSGRLSVQYENHHQPQALHVHFIWSQTPQQTMVTLNAPTGQTLAILTANAQGARLDQAGKPSQFASDADQLLLKMLGWPLPVDGLRDWLQGFITPGHSSALTESSAHDACSMVDGWRLCYTAWQQEQQIERPKRLDLTRQTEQAGLVSLRIVIDQWDGK